MHVFDKSFVAHTHHVAAAAVEVSKVENESGQMQCQLVD